MSNTQLYYRSFTVKPASKTTALERPHVRREQANYPISLRFTYRDHTPYVTRTHPPLK